MESTSKAPVPGKSLVVFVIIIAQSPKALTVRPCVGMQTNLQVTGEEMEPPHSRSVKNKRWVGG